MNATLSQVETFETFEASPAKRYVYIPNLVGRQMLKIEIDDQDDESDLILAQPAAAASFSQSAPTSPSTSRPSTPDHCDV
jgi:hypothetical protein